MTNLVDVREFYQKRVESLDQRLAEINRQSSRLTQARGWTFLAFAALVLFGVASDQMAWAWYTAAGVVFVGFLTLASMHETIQDQVGQLRHRRDRNRIQLARKNRDWKQVPNPVVDLPERHRAVAEDLDILGNVSLFQLVSTTHTPFGRQTLRDWLLDPASPQQIAERQQAVLALAGEAEFREEIELRARLVGANSDAPIAFATWAEGPTWLAKRRILRWTARVFTAGIVISTIAMLSGLVPPAVAFVAMMIIVLVNIGLNVAFAGTIQDIFNSVTSRNHDIQHYRTLFRLIADLPGECEFFNHLKQSLGSTPDEPIRLLSRLMKIVRFANLRRDGLFGVPYLISQVVVLTDFHLLGVLEKWQVQHGGAVRRWLETVGRLEAIASLATLAHDHPEWAMPTVERSDEKTVNAEAIGHPLLAAEDCVRNDATVGPAGTFLLVTGSNMSGKSTMLRALGVNVALAQAGGPVCAKRMELVPLRIATSMRIGDSLAEGVSFFMAELKRLKQIVDQSRDVKAPSDPTLFYLLDEILQGTNSGERHIAVSRVLGYLVKNGAIGAVSTHDLELANSPDLVTACQVVHFRETIVHDGDQKRMTFDYRMRSGLAPTTNALALLELVGLNE